jgi:hypothetical protein
MLFHVNVRTGFYILDDGILHGTIIESVIPVKPVSIRETFCYRAYGGSTVSFPMFCS